ncbi:MAG: hypothetical protein ABI678_12485, partial [Kofleriaceae bacterium]
MPTPADRARDAIASAKRQVDVVRRDVAELSAAHDANDPQRWGRAKQALGEALSQAERVLDTARGRRSDASPEAKAQLEAAATELAVAATSMHDALPPKGYVAIAHETELLDAIRRA